MPPCGRASWRAGLRVVERCGPPVQRARTARCASSPAAARRGNHSVKIAFFLGRRPSARTIPVARGRALRGVLILFASRLSRRARLASGLRSARHALHAVAGCAQQFDRLRGGLDQFIAFHRRIDHGRSGREGNAMRFMFILLTALSFSVWGQGYLGNYSSNPYAPNSTANPYGAGNPYNPNSINNPYSTYGSPYSPKSAINPYSTNAPKLYDSQGNYRGRLSNNPYDPDSVSNPYGRYGSPYSPDSINNPYGAGNPYSLDSPTNPYGQGLQIYGE